jgi:hypothetical protein
MPSPRSPDRLDDPANGHTSSTPTRAMTTRPCRKALRRRGITARIARRGIESTNRLGRHRYVIERTLEWVSRFRRLARRYERKAAHFLGFAPAGLRDDPLSPSRQAGSVHPQQPQMRFWSKGATGRIVAAMISSATAASEPRMTRGTNNRGRKPRSFRRVTAVAAALLAGVALPGVHQPDSDPSKRVAPGPTQHSLTWAPP